MFRATHPLALAVSLVLVAACSGEDATGPAEPPPSTTATISLTNNASIPIVRVAYSGCDESDWGPNRLGADETIAPGAVRSFTVPPGCYDVRASTSARNGYWYDRNISAGGTLVIALSAAANGTAPEPAGTGETGRKSR